ncbi:MAG: isocitrate lyase/phosphoenolpyruvate mutase family protein [Acidobacteria bacterium]|nr:isocitrate lyase/phosphoenolpyruvate mutase family protein [Acidobacteriota bacterium]MBS1868001.1 isocitrate lyase/phosphoenolpyruvate mutase family protein [Acidobacteriota bacterium]
MEILEQARKAEELRKLHHGPRLLLLPNAWDVASARILEEAGHPAIATTSAGIAYSLGYADGQNISRDEMLSMVARIARAVRVPVTADLESGYGRTNRAVAETVELAIKAGAVGMNLEDLSGDAKNPLMELPLQIEKIRAVRETATAMGVPFVLNARTDVYLAAAGPEATRFERTVERLRAYRDAGADCLFAPGISNLATIEKLARAVEAPLNILASPACPSIAELERVGVARVSTGSGVMRAAMGVVQRVAREMIEERSCQSMFAGATPYLDLKKMITRERS